MGLHSDGYSVTIAEAQAVLAAGSVISVPLGTPETLTLMISADAATTVTVFISTDGDEYFAACLPGTVTPIAATLGANASLGFNIPSARFVKLVSSAACNLTAEVQASY